MEHKDNRYTISGTDIEEVKRKNGQSGMSYNEAIEWMAKTSGGRGTAIYSDTNMEEVKKQNQSVQDYNKNKA
ncbi:gamma type small acid-soluble spore protein [Lederbergia galactosidilyticus]|uniref:gamma-type small acid-soluble spore protein n=1 Tax=Lederbergia galactosidilytica TaxID=217031 RepID=UPI001AEA7FB7|nr:gamma-type small acid-soluble spore protein [Lederbergia galactosidilytica]MBP1915803.1 gamma type small acid-soluble spore protein [Lederbergia galactosidilytica]